MCTILSPSYLPFISLSWPYTARPWHRDHLFPCALPPPSTKYTTRALHIVSDKQHAPVKYSVHFSCTLCWPESYLPRFCFHRTIPKCLELLPDMSDIAFDLAVFLLLQAWHESNIPVLFYIWNQLYFKALMSSGQLYITSSEIYLLNRCETDLLFHYSV